MTTIAWDGQTLAADRRLLCGLTPVEVTGSKVHCVTAPNGRVALFGVSANSAPVVHGWLNWLAGGEEPKWRSDDSWSAMLIDDERVVWYRTSNGWGWCSHGQRKWAIGSGSDFALGALEAGASSRRAVEVAMRLNVYTGGQIDEVAFETTSYLRGAPGGPVAASFIRKLRRDGWGGYF